MGGDGDKRESPSPPLNRKRMKDKKKSRHRRSGSSGALHVLNVADGTLATNGENSQSSNALDSPQPSCERRSSEEPRSAGVDSPERLFCQDADSSFSWEVTHCSKLLDAKNQGGNTDPSYTPQPPNAISSSTTTSSGSLANLKSGPLSFDDEPALRENNLPDAELSSPTIVACGEPPEEDGTDNRCYEYLPPSRALYLVPPSEEVDDEDVLVDYDDGEGRKDSCCSDEERDEPEDDQDELIGIIDDDTQEPEDAAEIEVEEAGENLDDCQINENGDGEVANGVKNLGRGRTLSKSLDPEEGSGPRNWNLTLNTGSGSSGNTPASASGSSGAHAAGGGLVHNHPGGAVPKASSSSNYSISNAAGGTVNGGRAVNRSGGNGSRQRHLAAHNNGLNQPAEIARMPNSAQLYNAVAVARGGLASPNNPLHNWQSGKHSLKERVSFMFCNEIQADIHFSVGRGDQRQRIPAHKFILSIGSAVFDAMFNGAMASRSEEDEIDLPDVEPAAFLALLRFLYSDDVLIGPESVMTTLYTAKKYAVPALENACVDFLKRSLSPDNAFMLLTQARLFDEPQLAALCLEMIDKHTVEALVADGFTDIDLETLCAVMERDTLRIRESALFQAVIRWSAEECRRQQLPVTPESQRLVLGRALHLVRFPQMTVEEFAQTAAQSGVLTDRQVVSLFLYFTVNPKPAVGFLDVPRCCVTGKEQVISRFQRIEGRWGYSGTPDRIKWVDFDWLVGCSLGFGCLGWASSMCPGAV